MLQAHRDVRSRAGGDMFGVLEWLYTYTEDTPKAKSRSREFTQQMFVNKVWERFDNVACGTLFF